MLNLQSKAMIATGLIVRLTLIFLIQPDPVINWYLPFIENSLVIDNFDPWGSWLNNNGSPVAFPYGYAMWLYFYPILLLSKIVGISSFFSYQLAILIIDVMLFKLLILLIPKRDNLVILAYWLSPIIILATYFLGFNDIIPVFIVLLSLFFLKRLNIKTSAFLMALAVSAKFSMIIIIPIFLIYLFNNKSLRRNIKDYIIGLVLGVIILNFPFLINQNGLIMLFTNPEIKKIFELVIKINSDILIYVLPMMYLLLIYVIWRFKTLNFDLFIALIAVVFLLIVLLTPSMLGWFVWCIPFLVFCEANGGKPTVILMRIFSLVYTLNILLFSSISDFIIQDISNSTFRNIFFNNLDPKFFFYSILIVIGIILSIRVFRESIERNDYFRLTKKPFIIGIAGDSGSGKDTFANILENLFGAHSVSKISGDNYHFWDRQKPIWNFLTHLNPLANDLESFGNDLIKLKDGKNIKSTYYNHENGKLNTNFITKSNNFIFSSGLHSLYLPIFRECYDLKVYLDMDEQLRKLFKIKRDVNHRRSSIKNVLDSLKNRKKDFNLFIKPQSSHANLIFSITPVKKLDLKKIKKNFYPRLKLQVCTRQVFNELSLTRILVGICGLHVENLYDEKVEQNLMTIEGDIDKKDTQLAVKLLCPDIYKFLDVHPKWEGGINGLIQLITLSHINQILKKRLL